MSLSASAAELNAALKTLRLTWEEVRAGWNDAAAQDFEERCWEPLHGHVLAALRGIDRLAPALAQADRECS